MTGYGSLEANDVIVIVKINPKDAVSVPSDSSYEKLRTCKYEVVGQYEGQLLKPLYSEEYQYDDDEDEDNGTDDYAWGWNGDTDEDEDEDEDDDEEGGHFIWR